MVTVLGPSRVTATGPTGVSSRCVPGADPAQVGQRHGDADRAVAAHAEVADVVEEDDAGGGGRIDRLEDQGADHHVRAARLVDDGRAERVVTVAEDREAIGHRAVAELGPARDHHAGRLAAGVRVDHAGCDARCLPSRLRTDHRSRLMPFRDAAASFGRVAMAWRMIARIRSRSSPIERQPRCPDRLGAEPALLLRRA